ncbi:7728_t:CDS:2, partial [Funneliformis caledonium]
SKQKKHLIKVSLRNKPIIVEDSLFEEDLSSEEGSSFDKNSEISSDDEIIIQTQKRRKAAAKKMAIQNGNTITQFFLPVQNEPDTQTDDTHSNELEGHDDINSSSTGSEIESDNEIELIKLIPFIEKKLQDEILLP